MSLQYNKINLQVNGKNILAESVNITESSPQKPIYSFNNNYFPLKLRWILLLEELNPEKVNCKNRASGKCKCGKLDEIKLN
jgi:hypothetical protein